MRRPQFEPEHRQGSRPGCGEDFGQKDFPEILHFDEVLLRIDASQPGVYPFYEGTKRHLPVIVDSSIFPDFLSPATSFARSAKVLHLTSRSWRRVTFTSWPLIFSPSNRLSSAVMCPSGSS